MRALRLVLVLALLAVVAAGTLAYYRSAERRCEASVDRAVSSAVDGPTAPYGGC